MKKYISPGEFSKQVGLSYDQVLRMCKLGEIETIKSPGGHYKISDREVDRLTKKDDFISKEEYELVIRENERLKIKLEQIKLLTV